MRLSRHARLVGLLPLAALAAACAKSPESVQASYVSPLLYRSLECGQLEQEAARVSSRLAAVSDAQKDAATRDAVATGVGVVLFWPALFFLAAGDSAEELSRLKGEYEAIESAAVARDCTVALAMREARDEAARRAEAEKRAREEADAALSGPNAAS